MERSSRVFIISVRSRRGSGSSLGRLWAASKSRASDSESIISMESQRTKTRSQYIKDRRKRPRKPSDQSGSSGDVESDRPASKVAVRKKARRRSTIEAEEASEGNRIEELRLRNEKEVLQRKLHTCALVITSCAMKYRS